MKIDIYVQPGAKKTFYAGVFDGRPKIKISAPPSDGAANAEVCRFMAKALNVSKSKVKISIGTASRLKTIEVDSEITLQEALELIQRQ
ncbi:MAG: DUF167 domain-containing protein [Deferribacterales bacterium]|nr:DUF167 domain-containing protein [Deferribacterales bacterium]